MFCFCCFGHLEEASRITDGTPHPRNVRWVENDTVLACRVRESSIISRNVVSQNQRTVIRISANCNSSAHKLIHRKTDKMLSANTRFIHDLHGCRIETWSKLWTEFRKAFAKLLYKKSWFGGGVSPLVSVCELCKTVSKRNMGGVFYDIIDESESRLKGVNN